MTLENCQRLVKHYQSVVDGHFNEDVKRNAREQLKVMKERVEKKLNHPKYKKLAPKKEEVKNVKR